jgi:leader peptidase (prepilin peptidase)/N-methyltransferase
MFILSLVLIFGMGACIGSFLNVVVLRLPSSEHRFLTQRSYCYNCHKTLFWRDMIPILSWFWLKGRCRFCHHRFSMRYALVELSIALLALTCALFAATPVQALEIFVFCAILIAIALIDLDTWTIPLQLPILITLTGLGFAYGQDLELLNARLIGLLAGFAFFAAFLIGSTWILRRIKRLKADENSMGWGDPVLIGAIGANLGWFWISWVVLLASLQGIILYCLVSFSRKPLPDDDWVPPPKAMPFGPFLALAAIEISLWNLI